MKEPHLRTLLSMRLLVGYLGERSQFAWWPTKFYEASSRPFLEPVFSKTSRLAQYHGVLEAARRLHDEHLNVGSFHLFRMPEEVEQDLHAIVQSALGEELATQTGQNMEAALEALTQLGVTTAPTGEGPIAVGAIQDIDSADVLQAIASAYLTAFSRSSRIYPYLVA
jgi:hypothetical protein